MGRSIRRRRRSSARRFVAGSPFLAMELANVGSLREHATPVDYPSVRHLLLQLLDALAHAHARGVLHRDVKPGNVLIFEDDLGRRAVKLADFGLAHALGRCPVDGELSATAGTPTYMAPEQHQGAWREFGPWTDLYALGCTAFRLVQGRPPFEGD